MVLRKLRFASSRFSAGDEAESASVLCERLERPRVKRAGRAAIVRVVDIEYIEGIEDTVDWSRGRRRGCADGGIAGSVGSRTARCQFSRFVFWLFEVELNLRWKTREESGQRA